MKHDEQTAKNTMFDLRQGCQTYGPQAGSNLWSPIIQCTGLGVTLHATCGVKSWSGSRDGLSVTVTKHITGGRSGAHTGSIAGLDWAVMPERASLAWHCMQCNAPCALCSACGQFCPACCDSLPEWPWVLAPGPLLIRPQATYMVKPAYRFGLEGCHMQCTPMPPHALCAAQTLGQGWCMLHSPWTLCTLFAVCRAHGAGSNLHAACSAVPGVMHGPSLAW